MATSWGRELPTSSVPRTLHLTVIPTTYADLEFLLLNQEAWQHSIGGDGVLLDPGHMTSPATVGNALGWASLQH